MVFMRLCTLAALLFAASHSSAALAQRQESPIGYPSVEHALADLLPQARFERSLDPGWLILSDEPGNELWTFTLEGNPAHPAAIKREIIVRDGNYVIRMSVLCQAAKEPCDAMVADYERLNAAVGESLRAQTGR